MLGHAKLISCFWSYKSLKNDQATRLFFIFYFLFRKSKLKENGVQTAKCIVEGEVWRQDYKMQTLVYPRVTVKAGMQERGTERGTEIKHGK